MSYFSKYCLLACLAATVSQADVIHLESVITGTGSSTQSMVFSVPYTETTTFSVGTNANLVFPTTFNIMPPRDAPLESISVSTSGYAYGFPGIGANTSFTYGNFDGFDTFMIGQPSFLYPGAFYTLSLNVTQFQSNVSLATTSGATLTSNGPIIIQGTPECSTWIMMFCGLLLVCGIYTTLRRNQIGPVAPLD